MIFNIVTMVAAPILQWFNSRIWLLSPNDLETKMNCFCYCWMLKLVLINTVDPAPQISCQHLTKLSDLFSFVEAIQPFCKYLQYSCLCCTYRPTNFLNIFFACRDLSYNEISGSFPSWLNSDLQLYVSWLMMHFFVSS